MKSLYHRRGSGRISKSARPTWLTSPQVFWPLCALDVTDEGVAFSFVGARTRVPFSRIDRVEVYRSGFLVFVLRTPQSGFAFSGWQLNKLARILREQGVRIDDKELRKLRIATISNRISTGVTCGLALGVTVFLFAAAR